MRLIKKIKKGTAVILSAALMAGLVPFMPHSVSKVQAAAGSKEPSVTAYATKEQLMDKTFTPNYKGISDIVGKLAFGNDEDGNIQEWYILGKDGGVNNVKDNTIIFAADSIKKEQIFEDISSGSTTKTYKEEYGNYGNNAPQEVYASHYGASELRKVLQDMVRDDNDTYFSDAEKAIMNEVKVTTEDSDYKRYTISDKLYAPGCDSYNYLSHKELLIAVNTNTKKIASSIYWAVGEPFWTRTPRYGGSISELTANPYEIQNSYRIEGHDVNEKLAVRPLANLNLATVLFASSATAATSDSAVYGTIAEGTAMRLRINGKNKDIGSVYYNFENGYIRATKGSISDTVSLVIQGNDGTNDWYYSKKIDKTDTVKVSDIQRALNISDDIDWRNCQIWLETTDEDRMTYAVPAEISTVFATKDQLMDSVLHYDGTPDCIGKLELGKNEDGAYSWYILGKDNNIDGDNTVIFTVSPLATGIKFNPDNNDVTFQEGMGTYTYYDYVPTTVSSDHYGACELRQNLLSIADSSRFTATEKSLMQATTLNMWDTLNSDSYTVSDKLYVPGGGYGDLDIKIGTFDKIILPMRTFWNNSQDSAFWLRTADTDHALIAVCGDKVGSRYFESAENVCAVRAASNLNLSSVLFASSATAFYSQTDEASVDVTSPSSTNVTYSTDGKTYSTNNPVFTDVGEYTVCYKIEKSNYDTVTGEKKVVIAKKDLEVKVDDQKIVWGNDIDNTKYNVSGLTEGDGISEITLKAGTTALTDNGTISVRSIAITNGSKDVTSNYDIALSDGKLVIEHNTSLAPTRLDAHKKKTAYEAGEILNVDDITVTAYYEDGYSEQITAYTTNADELDMNTVGEKILAVSYTKNGDTKTCRFKIIVTHTHGFDNAVWHSDSINHWKECTKSYCDKSDGYKIQEISHTCEYTYTWSDDYKTCTAVRKCSICEYTDSETAASDIVVVQNRDCTNPEIIEYVARFKNSLYNDFETQIKENFEAAPATGHNMSEWTSNRDNTHSRICTNSGCTYKETEKCSGGTATYFKKAICDDCKAEHGDFKADTIKPTGEIKLSDNTWNTLLNKITFGRFFSATQKVTIAGTDDSYSSDGFNLSEDAVKISYLIASGDEAKVYTTDELEKRFTAGEFKNYKASFNVNPDNKYVVFARIEDHAGNATYISSDGVVIDSTTPVIDGVAEGEIYCEKVEFTVSDDNFDKVTDIIGDDVQTLTSINGRYILADGMHKVIAYDKAGNSTEVNFVVNANHTVSEWMTDKEATIEETGSRHKECKVCGTILEKADIEKLVPLEYKIIAGADSSWSQNTDMNLVIKGNGDFAKFIRIKVDGVSVDATNYTVAEGSTIITLKPDYIKTLSVGSHVFEIIWKDGIASTSFTIVNNEVADTNNNQGTDITQTGDTAKPLLWSMLFMVSFAGFAVMSGRRKKKNCK